MAGSFTFEVKIAEVVWRSEAAYSACLLIATVMVSTLVSPPTSVAVTWKVRVPLMLGATKVTTWPFGGAFGSNTAGVPSICPHDHTTG